MPRYREGEDFGLGLECLQRRIPRGRAGTRAPTIDWPALASQGDTLDLTWRKRSEGDNGSTRENLERYDHRYHSAGTVVTEPSAQILRNLVAITGDSGEYQRAGCLSHA